MTSPTLSAALAHWHGRDRSELDAALTPPVDALGDEVMDLTLARTFRRLAGMKTAFEQVAELVDTIGVYRRVIVTLPDKKASRIETMIAVLERWVEAVLDDGAMKAVEGRAA